MTDDAHARPSGDAEALLYDVSVPTPTHAERARTMAASITTGALCTLCNEPTGYPYGSFTTFAFAGPDPVFLVSTLAEHTKNLKRDSRASLLVAESGASDPLANARVTLLGPCERVSEDERQKVRNAYLETHPTASYYVDFKDFGFWKLRVEAIRYIGGYGRMSWVGPEDWRAATVDPIAVVATGVIKHMNEDHQDSMVTMCKALTRAKDTSAATMTGIDRYGFEMSATTAVGPRPIRLAFDTPITNAQNARKALVALVKLARTKE